METGGQDAGEGCGGGCQKMLMARGRMLVMTMLMGRLGFRGNQCDDGGVIVMVVSHRTSLWPFAVPTVVSLGTSQQRC